VREKRQSDGCKQSIYFPGDMLAEIESEAKRLERSSSWVVVQCVKRGGLEHVTTLPGLDDVEAAE
jgi:uncharacterized small protein (TIGR04563 family)